MIMIIDFIIQLTLPAVLLLIFFKIETELKWFLLTNGTERSNPDGNQDYEYHWLHTKSDLFQSQLTPLLNQGYNFFNGSTVVSDSRKDTDYVGVLLRKKASES